ncbi:MAG TPA: hypothetical protein VHI93_01375 [Candidatus Thermoplasmatota archaeon]|nr:hypothetical protein [Candidatus Thermoplasmatota archaeon]
MSIERLHQSDLGALQYCTRCGLVFAMLKPAFEHGERCKPKEVADRGD